MSEKLEAKKLGLTDMEYDEIVKDLGREPNKLEVWLYSAMWSEHCSYKNSRKVLKRFPTEGSQVLQGPGENAGIVDIGDDLAVAMKIESHNHPSAIDPYNGAATGVGGILRDIFTMGARPIALLNSLRFGKIEDKRVKFLLEKAVEGMADYGNTMEVPTVAGEVYFDKSYKENPLVNAMCVGIIRHDEIVRGTASGVGNSVMLIGNATGREGVHGASFASAELGDDSNITEMQVGNPELERRLMEASLEIIKEDLVVGIQDLGAAGLISSSCEMAARAGSGIEIDVAKVHCKEDDITPYEIMLSETQERMLLIVKKGHEEDVKKICKKWDLPAVCVGTVTDDEMVRVLNDGKVEGEVPATSLAEGAPIVERESKKPEYMDKVKNIKEFSQPEDLNQVLLKLLEHSNIASKQQVYSQFGGSDNLVVPPGSDAAVVKIVGTNKAIALSCDCNGYYCFLDPFEGGKQVVAEAARNIVTSGAKPLAITDGLNFGSPENPEVYYQFEKCVDGISEAAKALGTPVISGNVSFYNESEGKAIFPTPVVGIVGVLDDVEKHCTMDFKNEGDLVILLGENTDEIGGSVYLEEIHGIEGGTSPKVDLEKEKKVQECCYKAIQLGLIDSAHDISEGGLAVALAESCISGNLGFDGEVETDYRADTLLFGEGQSRIIVSLSKSNLSMLQKVAEELGVKVSLLGSVKASGFKLKVNSGNEITGEIDIETKEIAKAWKNSLQRKLAKCATN